MKKIQVLALTAVMALGLASCSKIDNGSDEKQANLTIRITGDDVTRTIGTSATEVAATVSASALTGHIYILNPMGGLIRYQAMEAAIKTSAGQTIPVEVPADSRVFIIANAQITDNATLSALTNLTQIKAATANLALVTSYTDAPLSNSSGEPVQIDVDASGNTASVTVPIKPAVARLELHSLVGGTDDEGNKITNFDVTGVYVDDYYPSFTWGGSYAGTMSEIGSTGSAASMNAVPTAAKDVAGPWAAVNSAGKMTAIPAAGQVWGYYVAAGNIPRLIIKLENVKYTTSAAEVIDLSGTTYYLTVNGYENGGTRLTAFQKGNIYRLGAAGQPAFEFDKDDLGLTPNPVNLTLTVKVSVDAWAFVNLTPIL